MVIYFILGASGSCINPNIYLKKINNGPFIYMCQNLIG